MSRRPLVVLALALASVAIAACSDVTAPRQDETTGTNTSTCTVWNGSTGLTCQ